MAKKTKDNIPRETLESVGEKLKKLRESRGVTIAEAAESTKVSTLNITALEGNDYRALPADAFVRGLLAMYAEYLGANGEKITQQFFKERDESRFSDSKKGHTTANNMPRPKNLAERAHIPSAHIAGLIFLLLSLLFASYCYYSSWNPFSFITGQTNTVIEQEISPIILEPAQDTQKDLQEIKPTKNQPPKEPKASTSVNLSDQKISKFDKPTVIKVPAESLPSAQQASPTKTELQQPTEPVFKEHPTDEAPSQTAQTESSKKNDPLVSGQTADKNKPEQASITKPSDSPVEPTPPEGESGSTDSTTLQEGAFPPATDAQGFDENEEQLQEKKPLVFVRPEIRKKRLGSAIKKKPSETTYELQATFTEDTWIEVVVDGKKKDRKFFSNGDHVDWQQFQSLKLTFGKPDSAVLLLNGDTVLFPKDSGNNTTILSIPGDIPSE